MAKRKVTISHDLLIDLDMPAMTMVFHVVDPLVPETVKVGDNIKFTAEKVNGALSVVKVRRAG